VSAVALPVPVKLDFESFETPRQAAVAPKSVTLPKTTALTEAERVILERYAPAGFVVTADLQVRHFQGDASPLLRPVAGEASFSLLKLIRPDLMFEIQTAIREAKKSGSVVRREGIRFKHNDHWMISDLEVLPLPISSKTPNHTYFAVLFPTLRPSAHKGRTKITAGSKKEKVNEQERLKQELAATQIELRNTIENREASEEELRAASEEVLSSNEELQSTNEELATAKEELQSTNEELTTVNDELSRRNIELTHTASDLNNLLESVKIPIVIVSNDRTLRRFTSEATKLFNVIPSDIGRPIDQIRPKLDLPDLDNLLVQVIRTLRPVESEVRDQNGRWYSLQIRPYLTGENRIEGVLIAVIDINDLKQLSTAIVETIRESLLVLDSQLRVISANPAFYQTFQVKREETENRPLFELGNGQWDILKLRELLEKVLPEKQTIQQFEVEHNFPQIGRKTMLLSARQLDQDPLKGQKILLVIKDISEAKSATSG
jgi:two-component system, chemotaxis family, CheB/CheR fusion protein